MTAREQLVADYPFFCKVAKRVARGFPEHVRADCESEALVAMVDAADGFVQNGVTFRNYVAKIIEYRMIDAARKAGDMVRRTGQTRRAYSLDDPIGDPDTDDMTHADLLVSPDPSPHERAIVGEEVAEMADELAAKRAQLEGLPLRWKIALTGGTVAEVAEELDVSEARITQLRKRARQALANNEVFPAVVVTLEPSTSPLSERELEVLHLIAYGDSNEEAGKELHIATETIKSHMKHVTEKLVARNRVHAVSIAWEEDWWE